MDQIVEQLISSGPVGIVCAAAVYLIITVQRNNTKKSRDDDRDKLITRITLIENEIDRIKALDLDAKLAQIMTDLNWIKEKLK